MKPILLVGLAAVVGTSAGWSQVPDWYPPHNRVAPTISVSVTLEPNADFRYNYTVANGAAAQQRIDEFRLRLKSIVSTAVSPADWTAYYSRKTSLLDGFLLWGATGPTDPAWVEVNPMDIPSSLSEIAPGTSRSGFALLSPCAIVGPLRYYVRGYNHLVEAPEDSTGLAPVVPTWQEDAVQGDILGPGDCTVVADWGSGAAASEGFIGLVNFASGAVLPAGPVTIQLKLSRNGEQVFPQTLLVKLNSTTVTSSFRVNSRGDRVAVFTGAPLKSGRNTLDVSMNGIKPGTNQTVTDSDRFAFDRP